MKNEEIAAHEQSIFYEETKQKVLDDLSDGMVNLCPTKISQGKTLESVYNCLEDFFTWDCRNPMPKQLFF